ncbi:hypothetical protein BX666DRAFT_1899522 [Dichotomocladium elegans]|nr:hypothetical protein BX666DRAFT_1899522 [Dichotomocladium elegans]
MDWGIGSMKMGKDAVMMENGSRLFPVEMIIDYDQYMDLKPPERTVITKTESNEERY